MRIKSICILMLTFLICGCEYSKDNSIGCKTDIDNMIEINSYERLPDKLIISYTINNKYDYDIWICDGINRELRSEIGLKKDTLYLRYISSLPYDSNILIYAPPFAYYTKLLPNNSIHKTIVIDLPVKGLSSFWGSEKPIFGRTVSCVELQVGYLTVENINMLGDWAKKESDDIMIVQVIRDVKIDEKILIAKIDELKIPVEGK